MQSSFKLKMEQAVEDKKSNIILALDLPMMEPQKLLFEANRILEEVNSSICAIKLNRHLVLPLGLSGDLRNLVRSALDKGLVAIMDCKINDIGNTNRVIAEYYFKAGFEAVTANPFVGWEDGLEPVFKVAKLMNRGVILLVYMSHKAAWEGYGQKTITEKGKTPVTQYSVFAQKALEWTADGAVVGATYPEKIKEISSYLKGTVPIYSPGIGAQGGTIELAIKNGADYLIIGRAITMAKNSKKVAKNICQIAKKSFDCMHKRM